MRVKTIFLFVLIFLTIFGFTCGYFFGFLKNKTDDNKNEFVYEHREYREHKKHTESATVNFHYSFSNQRDFFDSAFENIAGANTYDINQIKGIITPHHLLASNLIAKVFYSISSKKPLTVVLISPNHFFVGRGQIISSLYDWKTPYGILESDKNVINQLRLNNSLNIDESPFENEHGIFNIVAFIKKTLPNAKIVPLIIKDTLSQKESDSFADSLEKFLPNNSLIVASLDFSHYLPSRIADFHDEKSLAVIENFDYKGIEFLDVDSKPTTRIFLKYLNLKNAKKFSLLDRSNSAYILNDKKISETTSYIAGLFSLGKKKGNKKVTVLSFGDLMLDRYIKNIIDKNGEDYPLKNIKNVLRGNDLNLANLEGSFTNFQPKPLNPNNTSFTFNPDLIPMLKRVGFNIFNLANNHSLDFSRKGFAQSKKYLGNKNIDYFGDPLNNNSSIVKNIRGTKIGFVGYNEFGNSYFNKVIEEIEVIKRESDFVIVYTHWGIEYSKNFSVSQQKKAHKFIDAGADIILGSHPHVAQPIEIYKNKIVFYSLGNFLFDQTFSKETQKGLGVGIVFDKDKIDYYLIPTETRNLQVNLPDKEETDKILTKLAEKSIVSENIKKQISEGKITIYH